MLSLFKNYLSSLGICPNEEAEEHITFQYNGLYYIFVHEKSDPNYFRLILPKIYKIDKEKEIVLSKVNDVNKKYKVAKTYITDDMVWTAAEQFVYSYEEINILFERCINLLVLVVEYFRPLLLKETDHD